MHGKLLVKLHLFWLALLLILLTSPLAAQTGLVAHYQFDEGSGTTAGDSSGNGNNGAITGAAWVDLPSGYCLSFDGVNDYVNCGNGASLNLTDAVTMVAWVCPWSAQYQTESGICGKGASPGNAQYMLTYAYNTKFYFYINAGGTNNIFFSVPSGLWNQIAVSYDRTAGVMKLYVNGVLKATKSYSTAISSGSNFYIGAACGSPINSPFKGLIDEVKVFNRQLSDSEVASEYSSSTRNTYNNMFAHKGVEDGLVAHYAFNEGSGTTVNDSSGFLNTGTVSNTGWETHEDGYSLLLSIDELTNSYVDCGNKSGLDINGPITVMAWVNPSSEISGEVAILGKGTAANNCQYLLTYYKSNSRVYWYINWGSGGTCVSASVSQDTWTHIAATYDKNNLKIYVNGSFVAQAAYTGSINSGNNLQIGRVGTSQYFKGRIDEVRIYNRALSDTQVSERYSLDQASFNGLVAFYRMNEGAGTATTDASGHGNSGNLNGCSWVPVNTGHCLYFNGTTDYVNCGNGSSLSLDTTDRATMVAWICPDSSQTEREPGIIGKGYESYQTTYYKNNMAWSYIGSGGSIAAASASSVMPGSWNQIATTFDGTHIKVYVNGMLAGKRRSANSTIHADTRNLLIGMNNSSDYNFKGYIDDVRVYNRALSAAEVAALFSSNEQSNRNAMFSVTCNEVTAVQSITSGDVTVKVGAHGGIQVNKGAAYFVMNGSYSYPGAGIGYNRLSETSFGGEAGWSPSVTKPNSTTIQVTATGAKYSLNRQIRLVARNGATVVTIEDTLTKIGASEVGILIDHSVITPANMSDIAYGIEASCPLLFFSQAGKGFGIVGEDRLGRLMFHPAAVANSGGIHHTNFGLDESGSYTFKYAIYPISTVDVFDVINRVRKDWNANVTIGGPCRAMDINDSGIPWGNPDNLKIWVQRRNLNVAALLPWLDYDPGRANHVYSRSEYQSAMATYTAKLKAANPNIKCLGSIETDWVNLDPSNHTDTNIPLFPAIPQNYQPSYGRDNCWVYWGDVIKDYGGNFTHNSNCVLSNPGPGEYLRVGASRSHADDAIANSTLIWTDPYTSAQFDFADSIKRIFPGQHVDLECYSRGGNPMYALSVYPTYMANRWDTNSQYDFLMNQAAFIMDSCGMDGFYADEFSQAWGGSNIYSSGLSGELQWDGHSVMIDPGTGQISAKLVDCSYAGIGARENLMNAVAGRDKVMTANTYSTSPEEQSLIAWRFAETWAYTYPDTLTQGVEPTFNTLLFSSSLGTPIGLGCQNWADTGQDIAQGLMLCLMKYLRHGMVMYHYVYDELPISGFGSGEYGPINHMFPITPQELHKGWIKGNERIVTGVSISNVSWNNPCVAPLVHFFDIHGREIAENPPTRQATITGSPGNWNVSISMSNWNEFAVVEESDGLVAHYKFDDGSGSVAIDSSGNGNTAIINKGAWFRVNNGYALSLDGSKSFVDCGNSVLLDLKGQMTMSAWVCPSSHQVYSESAIMGKSKSSYLATYKRIGDDGYAYWYINSSYTNSPIPHGNRWSLVTLTFDGTYLRVYINGSLAQTQYNPATINTGGNFFIGCDGVSNGLPLDAFKGLIDDVRIYKRCLSPTEVGALFSTSEKNTRDAVFSNWAEDGLMVFYKMDEGTGNTLTDYSGFGNTATIYGAEWLNLGSGNYALEFDDKKSAYVDCGAGPSHDITGPITVISWVHPLDEQDTNEVGIVGKRYDRYQTTYYNNGNYQRLYWYINAENTYFILAPGDWHQVATTYDGATMKMYLDGYPVSSSSKSYSADAINSGPNLYLGCTSVSNGTPIQPFKGFMDHVKIYNYVLSDDKILDEYRKYGLVAWYTLSEGSGGTIADSSGNNNHGVLYDVDWTTRKTGANALEFKPNKSAYVDCGGETSLDISGPMTLIAWVNPDSSQENSEPGVIGKGLDSYLMTWWRYNANSYFYINAGGNNANYPVSSGTWTQIAAVFDPSNSDPDLRLRMYINGVLRDNSSSLYTVVNEGGNLYIGCRGLLNGEPQNLFKGKIGDVRIYNRVLTDTEISNLYDP